MSYKQKFNHITVSEFWCTRCGNQGLPIMRRAGQQREAGHLKRLWCPYCNIETNHAEIQNFGSYTKQDFKQEFELGRFINGKRIPISELLDCDNQECKYNVNGKCWNANYSFNCKHRVEEEEY